LPEQNERPNVIPASASELEHWSLADRLSEKCEIGYHVKNRTGVYDDYDAPRFDGERMATKEDANVAATTIDLSDEDVAYLISVLRDPSCPQPVTTQRLIDALRSRSAA
jgi:hypothetical protein